MNAEDPMPTPVPPSTPTPNTEVSRTRFWGLTVLVGILTLIILFLVVRPFLLSPSVAWHLMGPKPFDAQTTLDLDVDHPACANAPDWLSAPEVIATPLFVMITMRVSRSAGDISRPRCGMYLSGVQIHVPLGAPLGDRILLDGHDLLKPVLRP